MHAHVQSFPWGLKSASCLIHVCTESSTRAQIFFMCIHSLPYRLPLKFPSWDKSRFLQSKAMGNKQPACQDQDHITLMQLSSPEADLCHNGKENECRFTKAKFLETCVFALPLPLSLYSLPYNYSKINLFVTIKLSVELFWFMTVDHLLVINEDMI